MHACFYFWNAIFCLMDPVYINCSLKPPIIQTKASLTIIKLTMEFTLIMRLGEPLMREGKTSTDSNAGAK